MHQLHRAAAQGGVADVVVGSHDHAERGQQGIGVQVREQAGRDAASLALVVAVPVQVAQVDHVLEDCARERMPRGAGRRRRQRLLPAGGAVPQEAESQVDQMPKPLEEAGLPERGLGEKELPPSGVRVGPILVHEVARDVLEGVEGLLHDGEQEGADALGRQPEDLGLEEYLVRHGGGEGRVGLGDLLRGLDLLLLPETGLLDPRAHQVFGVLPQREEGRKARRLVLLDGLAQVQEQRHRVERGPAGREAEHLGVQRL
mmetsp:Transcript_98594/g.283289  ORF Transcript_98594/g.283289 Transcript_98594/m.283289 type:complete len:258 (-) Transcript_98594:1166-1939(-)